ncbi:hypothetical protein PIIN_08161 [Serendipita indica DSM 11827]|uniref:Uncharacterized protein n=1 Tax=Serendipita indica (strain DSM 11827) TaxID=1109443 RepID=G4TSB5_SERID|nr:hypothetical protein PIIN_08161 [Serendipita indica DSM 11827]
MRLLGSNGNCIGFVFASPSLN